MSDWMVLSQEHHDLADELPAICVLGANLLLGSLCVQVNRRGEPVATIVVTESNLHVLSHQSASLSWSFTSGWHTETELVRVDNPSGSMEGENLKNVGTCHQVRESQRHGKVVPVLPVLLMIRWLGLTSRPHEGTDSLALNDKLGEVPEFGDGLEMEQDPIDRRAELCTSESCTIGTVFSMAWSSSWRCELLLSEYTNRRSTVKYQGVASAEGRSLKEITKARPEFVEQDGTPVWKEACAVTITIPRDPTNKEKESGVTPDQRWHGDKRIWSWWMVIEDIANDTRRYLITILDGGGVSLVSTQLARLLLGGPQAHDAMFLNDVNANMQSQWQHRPYHNAVLNGDLVVRNEKMHNRRYSVWRRIGRREVYARQLRPTSLISTPMNKDKGEKPTGKALAACTTQYVV
ncbi:hypothetical protein C8Q74DRAFT_1215431 [Fomes fomentarius]|nr:hypothetical protein C8Q74DRAFT_1215430 [Fomes fomentarius]KAI0793991.1 hypothetical protein C8Q74DRAFT_1215431 [Fomes fomentarius]